MEMERVLYQEEWLNVQQIGEERADRTLQIPHAALHSSLVADTWFA
jgi:hypothetical protein